MIGKSDKGKERNITNLFIDMCDKRLVHRTTVSKYLCWEAVKKITWKNHWLGSFWCWTSCTFSLPVRGLHHCGIEPHVHFPSLLEDLHHYFLIYIFPLMLDVLHHCGFEPLIHFPSLLVDLISISPFFPSLLENLHCYGVEPHPYTIEDSQSFCKQKRLWSICLLLSVCLSFVYLSDYILH